MLEWSLYTTTFFNATYRNIPRSRTFSGGGGGRGNIFVDFKINHIHGGKREVSESIIANHTRASLVHGEKICGFVLTTKSTKILPLENFLLHRTQYSCGPVFSMFVADHPVKILPQQPNLPTIAILYYWNYHSM